jgi:hypothetical protein
VIKANEVETSLPMSIPMTARAALMVWVVWSMGLLRLSAGPAAYAAGGSSRSIPLAVTNMSLRIIQS